MRLTVSKPGRTISEFRFARGPVYIGRHSHSQIFLPDKAVSRQHAVIFATQPKKWILEDLHSANKTYLNGEEVQKADLKTGDTIRIADYTIGVDLEEDEDADKPVRLDDTLVPAGRRPQIIRRKLESEHAPDIRLPANRATHYLAATEAICEANGPNQMAKELLKILLTHFSARRAWCAVRTQLDGPMAVQAGMDTEGKPVSVEDIGLQREISHAAEKHEFLLMLGGFAPDQAKQIGSAMLGPVIGTAGCYGVLYVDNGPDKEHYSLADLDYLMLLAVHTAAILRNF